MPKTKSGRRLGNDGGRIELSSDSRGNIYVEVIPDEEYAFIGQTTGSGEFKETGIVTIRSKTTFTAQFSKE